MEIIQSIDLPYTARQTNPGSADYKKHSEVPELSRFTADIVHMSWIIARLTHHLVLSDIVQREPAPVDWRKGGAFYS